MMKEAWTKGPWTAWRWGIMGADNNRIARVIPWDESGSREEYAANVHLIAAAPELWDALAALVEHDEYLIECEVLRSFVELERAKAILKKARGES